jgi:hypothetical protein
MERTSRTSKDDRRIVVYRVLEESSRHEGVDYNQERKISGEQRNPIGVRVRSRGRLRARNSQCSVECLGTAPRKNFHATVERRPS